MNESCRSDLEGERPPRQREQHRQKPRGRSADGALGQLKIFLLARGRVGENSGERGSGANQTGPPRPWSGVSALKLKATGR